MGDLSTRMSEQTSYGPDSYKGETHLGAVRKPMPDIQTMRLCVAKMLPGDIQIVEHFATDDEGKKAGEPWKIEFRHNKAPHFYAELTEWEWLHVAWLAEQALTKDERYLYFVILNQIAEVPALASAEIKLDALCQVKNPEIFTK